MRHVYAGSRDLVQAHQVRAREDWEREAAQSLHGDFHASPSSKTPLWSNGRDCQSAAIVKVSPLSLFSLKAGD
jgi:hypothetical protein